MVFKAFFNAGLGCPTVLLLEEVLRYFYVELPQLHVNAIVRLAIFEWAMRANGCEGRVDLFVTLHYASCEPKTRTEDGVMKALSFRRVNFQLQPEYKDAFPTKANNSRWYTG